MTSTKAIGFAHRWGLGGVLLGNVFSRIATDPKGLADVVEISRPLENEERLLAMSRRAATVVYAWGAFPLWRPYFAKIAALLNHRGPYSFGVTKGGFPRHISRLAYETKLEPWRFVR